MLIDLGPNLLFTDFSPNFSLFPEKEYDNLGEDRILIYRVSLAGIADIDLTSYDKWGISTSGRIFGSLKSTQEWIDVLNAYCLKGFSEPVFELWFKHFCLFLNRHYPLREDGQRAIKLFVIVFSFYDHPDIRVRMLKILKALTSMFSAYTTFSEHFKNTAFDDYLIVVDSSMNYGSAIVNSDYVDEEW